ncbi:MAG: hypothetical protein ACYSTW_06090, partial [Planctomycetota bacterium]
FGGRVFLCTGGQKQQRNENIEKINTANDALVQVSSVGQLRKHNPFVPLIFAYAARSDLILFC